LMLLPRWLPINIYEMSSWTRAMVVPLTIIYAHQSTWAAPACPSVDELFCGAGQSTVAFERDREWFTWRNMFLALNRLVGWYERFPWNPLRRQSLRLAENWLLEPLGGRDGLAAIYPAMMNAVFALLALGRTPADPLTARQIDRLRDLELDEGN